MAEPKPPYVVVRSIASTHVPTLYMTNRQGEYQAADTRPVEDDALTAKRVAVAWAKEMGVEFRPSEARNPYRNADEGVYGPEYMNQGTKNGGT